MANHAVAERIIGKLSRRGGFDAWWDDIDRDIRQEIRDEMAELIPAEQPAPSAPAEFDPWEALAERWAQLQHNVSFHQRDAVIPKSVWAAGKQGAGRTFREAALNLCRKLGLTESPKGKEGANG